MDQEDLIAVEEGPQERIVQPDNSTGLAHGSQAWLAHQIQALYHHLNSLIQQQRGHVASQLRLLDENGSWIVASAAEKFQTLDRQFVEVSDEFLSLGRRWDLAREKDQLTMRNLEARMQQAEKLRYEHVAIYKACENNRALIDKLRLENQELRSELNSYKETVDQRIVHAEGEWKGRNSQYTKLWNSEFSRMEAMMRDMQQQLNMHKEHTAAEITSTRDVMASKLQHVADAQPSSSMAAGVQVAGGFAQPQTCGDAQVFGRPQGDWKLEVDPGRRPATTGQLQEGQGSARAQHAPTCSTLPR